MVGAILVAGDEFNKRVHIVEALRSLGYRLIEAETGIRVLELSRRYKNISLAFIDTSLFDIDVLSLVTQLRMISPKLPIVLLYEEESLNQMKLETVKEALFKGADYLLPYNCNELQLKAIVSILLSYRLLEHNVYYKTCIDNLPHKFEDFIANSEAMQTCIKLSELAVSKDTAIFIDGEYGAGRRQIAKAIHLADEKRKNYNFISFYCDLEALENANIENWITELNHHIEQAENGILCLINVEALSKTQQAYLNEALIDIKARIICLINSNPKKWKKNSQLADLYKKLTPIYLTVPPLRKRREDIEELAQGMVGRFAVQMGLQQKIFSLTGAANALLTQYDWPGNLSELEKTLYHALLLSNGPLLQLRDFPRINGQLEDVPNIINNTDMLLFKEDGHIKTLGTIEIEAINKAIEHYKGSLSEVARRLNIGRSTLYRKLYKN